MIVLPNVLIYLILFIMGSFFGSFLTLATFRIPLKQDITHERSYCPTCGHKLGFFDLFPIFSYIFLGGKCRYCKTKIGPRYFLLEIITGILFVVIAGMLGITIRSGINDFIHFGIIALYIVFLLLVATIDKEHSYIDISVITYGTVVTVLYVLYAYFNVPNYNLYNVFGYYLMNLILVIINTRGIKRHNRYDYVTKILIVLNYMFLMAGAEVGFLTVIILLIIYGLLIAINKTFNTVKIKSSLLPNDEEHKKTRKYINGKEDYISKIPVAYYLVVAHIIVILVLCIYANMGAII